MRYFFSVGGGGAARISQIFLYKESGKCFFFYKKSKSNKKNLAVGRGGGAGVARVSDFFSFFKRIQVSEKNVFFLRG